MIEMTEQEIRDYIEEVYPKVKELVAGAGMTKEQWIKDAIEGPRVYRERCENCANWKCSSIEQLEEKYSMFVEMWYKYGCPACSDFRPSTTKIEGKE